MKGSATFYLMDRTCQTEHLTHTYTLSPVCLVLANLLDLETIICPYFHHNFFFTFGSK